MQSIDLSSVDIDLDQVKTTKKRDDSPMSPTVPMTEGMSFDLDHDFKPGNIDQDKLPASAGIQFGGPDMSVGALDGPQKEEGSIFISQMSKIFDKGQNKKVERVKLGVLLALSLVLLAWQFVDDSQLDDAISMVSSFVSGTEDDFSDDFGGFDEEPTIEEQRPLEPAVVATQSEVPSNNRQRVEDISRNPYWPLPNVLGIERYQNSGDLSVPMEQRWKAGLDHPYTSHRYTMVREMRASRKKGSEYLLLEALSQKKLWIRMEALMGLVELGFNVNVAMVEKAFGDARPDLIRNYLKRLTVEPGPAQVYVMMQAIRIVDDRTRIQILDALSKVRGQGIGLYFAAAAKDPSPRVRKWIQTNLVNVSVPQTERLAYKKLMEDYANGTLAFESQSEKNIEVLNPDKSLVETVREFLIEDEGQEADEAEEEILSLDELEGDGFEDMLDLGEVDNATEN